MKNLGTDTHASEKFPLDRHPILQPSNRIIPYRQFFSSYCGKPLKTCRKWENTRKFTQKQRPVSPYIIGSLPKKEGHGAAGWSLLFLVEPDFIRSTIDRNTKINAVYGSLNRPVIISGSSNMILTSTNS